jgi:hypothetical protein
MTRFDQPSCSHPSQPCTQHGGSTATPCDSSCESVVQSHVTFSQTFSAPHITVPALPWACAPTGRLHPDLVCPVSAGPALRVLPQEIGCTELDTHTTAGCKLQRSRELSRDMRAQSGQYDLGMVANQDAVHECRTKAFTLHPTLCNLPAYWFR